MKTSASIKSFIQSNNLSELYLEYGPVKPTRNKAPILAIVRSGWARIKKEGRGWVIIEVIG